MMKLQSGTFKFVAVLSLALALGACSKKNTSAGLNADGLAGSAAQVPGSEQDFQANIGDRVFFNEDQSTLTAEAKQSLMKQVRWLAQYSSVNVQIEGHADERGTREYNISLSARRATAVRAFMIQQGISASRIATIAYGKERPAALCDAEECWSQNRRAVTVITGGLKTS